MKLTDEQIFENEIKCITRRNECLCNGGTDCIKCDLLMDSEEILKCYNRALKNLDLINRQKAEIERLEKEVDRLSQCVMYHDGQIADAIKELGEKVTEVFMRYAHLHTYADAARKDYIETVDGKEIEMQSVWDVFSLKKYEMAEYEEMSRLQKNIETIEKERLLTELEKDFRLLVKEMAGE